MEHMYENANTSIVSASAKLLFGKKFYLEIRKVISFKHQYKICHFQILLGNFLVILIALEIYYFFCMFRKFMNNIQYAIQYKVIQWHLDQITIANYV